MKNIELIAKRTVEILGGKESANQTINSEFQSMENQWARDTDYLGRILRSHLYVEHYMTKYLQESNPRLGKLSSTRITFSQKIDLLDPQDELLIEIIPGIRQLNKIRNKLAHNLSEEISDKELQVFLSIKPFAAIIIELAKPNEPYSEPILIIEKFSQYVACVLNHQFSRIAYAFKQAIRESIEP